MSLFTKLFFELKKKDNEDEIVKMLASYFDKADEDEKLWALYLLLGGRIRKSVTPGILRSLSCERSGIPLWLFEESMGMSGDLAEVSAEIVPTVSDSPLSLVRLIDIASAISKIKDSEEKNNKIVSVWDTMDRDDRYFFNKLITGALRGRTDSFYVYKALEYHTGISRMRLQLRLRKDWSPQNESFYRLVFNEVEKEHEKLPMVFAKVASLDKKQSQHIDGFLAEWIVPGIPAQIVLTGAEYFLWSTQGELLNDEFPEFSNLKTAGKMILEGRIVRRDWESGIAVKKKSPSFFLASDLLKLADQTLEVTLQERFDLLLRELKSNTAQDLLLVQDHFRLSSLPQRHEIPKWSSGIFFRSPDEIRSDKFQRYEWIPDPYFFTGVLLYVSGGGWGGDLYTKFTFGVRNSQGELVPVTATEVNLADDEILHVHQFVKENTIEKFGPVRSIRAELLFRISFDTVLRSKHHKSGIVLHGAVLHSRLTDAGATLSSLDELESLLI